MEIENSKEQGAIEVVGPETKSSTSAISPRKREANRRNAQKSTGPKSRSGKEKVRWNALQHGILAKGLSTIADGKDVHRRYEHLLRQLQREWRPVGVLEEMEIETIAHCYIRLGRVLRAEKAEIEQQMNLPAFEHVEHEDLAQSVVITSYQEAQGTSTGVARAIWFLDEAMDELATGGSFTEFAANNLAHIFGGDFEAYVAWCAAQLPISSSPKDRKQLALLLLQERRKELENREMILRENELFRSAAERDAHCLPGQEEAEKILRYEAAIRNFLSRATMQLERLQRQRKGDYVVPPTTL